MLQSFHQSAETFEIIFNKGKYDALAPELKAILKYAAESASSDMLWKAYDRYSKDLEGLKARGVQVMATPRPILEAQLAAWDKVIAALSADPFFAKVVESQKSWCKRTMAYQAINSPPADMAYAHFFGRA
jgi:TRAP-type mannitol/chloroaromatic compound transport system substrate-binding protein